MGPGALTAIDTAALEVSIKKIARNLCGFFDYEGHLAMGDLIQSNKPHINCVKLLQISR